MMPLSVHEIIPAAVERTLDSLVGGIVLCGIAWTWLRVAQRQNSASRFFILFILLIGIAVLPFAGLSWLTPAGVTASSDAHSLITLPAHSAEYLFLAWSVIASILLLRVAVGLVQLRRLKQSCVPVDSTVVDSRIQTALHSCSRRAELCVSDQVNVPTALGFGATKIAIPTWLHHQLSPEELHHLVLHELAHLRRWDDWTNLAQRVLGALLFFHPAVWWLQSRIALEREMACDECVLAETGNARAYAKSLANIAERSLARRTIALAQAAVSRLHDTTLRVAKIMSPAPLRANSVALLIASAAAFGGVSVAVAVYSPNLVGFAEPPAPVMTSASVIPAVQLEKFAPPPVMASLKTTSRPAKIAPKISTQKPVIAVKHSAPVATMARAETKPSLFVPAFVPAKVKHDHMMTAQPAMLVVWQESVSADGSVVTIQQSYWRVVVFENVTPREQPAKTT
jgi:beta-lactamase regulating signal transducer with metallopeptidase domain